MQQQDFHIVYHTVGGKRYLSYALPNTSQFSIEDQVYPMTVKASVKSMSGLILLNVKATA